MENKVALVVGASGIVGLNLAAHLTASSDWTVYGLARKPPVHAGIRPVAADLLQPDTLAAVLSNISPTHVFLTTWLRQPHGSRKHQDQFGHGA